MKKPKKLSKCPFCDGTDIHILKCCGNWYYKCSKCNEEFTTTESDTISLKTSVGKKIIKTDEQQEQ